LFAVVSPSAFRSSSGTREERKAAFAILNELERIEANVQLSVDNDLHDLLANPQKVMAQVREVQEQERERTVSRDRDLGWSR